MTIFYALKNLPKETLDKLSILVACNPDEETVLSPLTIG